MSIVRVSHDKEKPYVMLNRAALQDPMLSWEAKGLWAYLLSLPDAWEISVAHLSNFYQGEKKRGGGEKAIYALIAELAEQGYIYSQVKKEKGRFTGLDYTVFESKQPPQKKKDKESKSTENPDKLKKCSPNAGLRDAVLRDAVIHRQTINNDRKEVFKKNDINVREDRSSLTLNSIAFDPEEFILPNGAHLSDRMKRSLRKYTQEQWQDLLPNVAYFQAQVAKGIHMPNPEAYLQSCISKNYAKESDNSFQNRLYAEWAKDEYKLRGLQILKTVVKFKRSSREAEESISLSLPPESFSAALDGYISKNERSI